MSVGEYATLAHAAIDDARRGERSSSRRRRDGPVPARGARGPRDPPPPSLETRARGSRRRYDADPAAAYARPRALDPAAAAARARERPPPRRPRARAGRERQLARADRGPSSGRRSMRRPTLVVGLDVSRRGLADRIETARRACCERGVAEEVRARSGSADLDEPPRRRSACASSPTLPLDEAARAHRRCARAATPPTSASGCAGFPGIVLVDADRPPEEVADEILDLARAR